MAIADYVGRTFDLLALRGAKATGDTLLSQSLFGPTAAGEVCTGAQKVSQRWAIKFLTRKGSRLFRPDDGCHFIDQARNAGFRTEVDVQIAFQMASADVDTQMRNEDTPDMNPEDRFDVSALLSITIRGDSLSLHVQITTAAGTTRRVILPVSLLPIALT